MVTEIIYNVLGMSYPSFLMLLLGHSHHSVYVLSFLPHKYARPNGHLFMRAKLRVFRVSATYLGLNSLELNQVQPNPGIAETADRDFH